MENPSLFLKALKIGKFIEKLTVFFQTLFKTDTINYKCYITCAFMGIL